MNDEQINAAIAEACGWTDIGECTCGFKLRGYPPEYSAHRKHIPNYCSDLNAMHEAEKVLDGVHSWNGEEHHWNAEEAYMGHITNIIVRNSGQKISDDWQLVCATARQRAEAFLRTLGKWEATDKDSLTVQAATTEQSSVDHLRDATKMMEEAQP